MHLYLYFAQTAVRSDANVASTTLIGFNVLMQALVFGIAAYLVFRLWSMILNAWSGANDAKSKALLQLVGGIDTAGDTTVVSAKAKGRLRGFGLLGTLAIFGFACLAIFLLGQHEIR